MLSAHVRLRFRNRFARERAVCLWFLLIMSERNCLGERGGETQRGLVSYLHVAETRV